MNRVTLGDVAVERRETYRGDKSSYPVVGLEHLAPEEINLTEWDTSGENNFTKLFHKGDILFGRRRAYLKKAAIAPFDGICSDDITVIGDKPDYILPELLPFVIQNDAFFDFAVEKSAGSLSPRAKGEHLKNYKFRLSPLDEQRKLVKALWAVNDTMEAYKKLLAATDELVKSQFIEMFGDPASNPKKWRKCCIEDIMRSKASNGFFAKQNAYKDDGNIGVVCVGDGVNRKYSNVINLRRTDATDEDVAKLDYLTGIYCSAVHH